MLDDNILKVVSTVLDEVRHQNLTIYNRLRTIIASEERHFFVFSNENHRFYTWKHFNTNK